MRSLLVVITSFVFSFLGYSQSINKLAGEAQTQLNISAFSEALKTGEKMLSMDSNSSEAHFFIALARKNMQDLKGAMHHFNKAIEKDNQSTKTLKERGKLKAQLKDYRGACGDFTLAIQIDSLFLDAYYNRAMANKTIHNFELALEDLNKLIEISPKDADAHLQRGSLKIEMGLKEEGCLDYSKAGELGDFKAYKLIEAQCN